MRNPLLLVTALVALNSALTAQPHITDPGVLPPTDSVLKVAVGDRAPDFSLPALDGTRLQLSDYRGKHNVILSFVPAAFTPVCSGQWPGYNVLLEDFAEYDAVLIGITVDNRPSLVAWVDAMGGLGFPVLSDFYPHGGTAAQYGILRSDGTTERALFVVDKEGILRFIDVHDINQRPPLEEIFTALEELKKKVHPLRHENGG